MDLDPKYEDEVNGGYRWIEADTVEGVIDAIVNYSSRVTGGTYDLTDGGWSNAGDLVANLR